MTVCSVSPCCYPLTTGVSAWTVPQCKLPGLRNNHSGHLRTFLKPCCRSQNTGDIPTSFIVCSTTLHPSYIWYLLLQHVNLLWSLFPPALTVYMQAQFSTAQEHAVIVWSLSAPCSHLLENVASHFLGLGYNCANVVILTEIWGWACRSLLSLICIWYIKRLGQLAQILHVKIDAKTLQWTYLQYVWV